MNRVVIGCGSIANEMAHGLEKMSRTLCSVANRTHEKAVDFVKSINDAVAAADVLILNTNKKRKKSAPKSYIFEIVGLVFFIF